MVQLAGFGKVTTLQILQHLFNYYGTIDKIDLKGNTVKRMGPYDPAEPLFLLITKIEKGGEFTRAVGKTISVTIMVSK